MFLSVAALIYLRSNGQHVCLILGLLGEESLFQASAYVPPRQVPRRPRSNCQISGQWFICSRVFTAFCIGHRFLIVLTKFQAHFCVFSPCGFDIACISIVQRLSRAHAVLSDAEKRAVYDESGIVDDGGYDVSSSSSGGGNWETYFRDLFPQVTLAKVEAFAKEYQGSREERLAVLEAYASAGDDDVNDLIGSVVDAVMCANEDDSERFRIVIDAAIESGEIEARGDDALLMGKEKASSTPAAKKAKAKKDAAAKRRRANADKEAAEAEELLKDIQARQQARLGSGGASSGNGGSGGDSGLVSMIQARNASRASGFDAWAAGLEARYGATKHAKKDNKKGNKKASK